MRLPRWVLVVLLVAAAVAAAAMWPKPPISVKWATVERGQVEDVVTSAASGEIKSAHETEVRSELAGTVVAVKAQRGDRVAAGKVIVALDAAELDGRIAQARAQVAAAQAALAQAQAQEASAKPIAARVLRLSKEGAATRDALDRATSEAMAADAAVEAARAQIAEAQASLHLAEIARRKADIAAPFAGVLQQVYPEVGASLVPGAPVFDLLDDAAARVETTIDEADAARIRVGQPVEMTLDAYPGVRFHGTVSLIAPAVAPDPRLGTTRSLPIWVSLPPDPRLRIVMSCTVEIIVSRKTGVLWVPSQVVIGRGAERSVYRFDAGVLHKVVVDVGLSNWERTEILAGLHEGDRVVTSLDSPGLKDGANAAEGAPDGG